MALRSIAEQLTHRLVVRRRLPSPFESTRLYVSTEGGLRYLKRSLAGVDDVLLGIVNDYVNPGDSVWDIGANLGLFAIAAAAKAGPNGSVLAVEPDPWLAHLLGKSARVNSNVAAITVLCAAITGELGVRAFNIARRSRATNFLDGYGTSQTGGIRSSIKVSTLPLDVLAQYVPPPAFLKIDVEGAEVEVLKGAGQVLGSMPAVLIEVAMRNSVRVDEILRPFGYRYFDADRGHVAVDLPVAQTLALAPASCD